MDKIRLNDAEKKYIQDNKYWIEDGNWDEIFYNSRIGDIISVSPSKVYQFIMFEAGIDLLRKMSYIPDRAFEDCEYDFGNIVIPSNIKRLGDWAFCNVPRLTSIDLSKTKIKEIPRGGFQWCRNLEDVVLPKTCKRLSVCAFSDCSHLKHINLSSVESVDGYAFLNNTKLTSVDLSSLKGLSGTSFVSCGLTDIKTNTNVEKFFRTEFPDANIVVV